MTKNTTRSLTAASFGLDPTTAMSRVIIKAEELNAMIETKAIDETSTTIVPNPGKTISPTLRRVAIGSASGTYPASSAPSDISHTADRPAPAYTEPMSFGADDLCGRYRV